MVPGLDIAGDSVVSVPGTTHEEAITRVKKYPSIALVYVGTTNSCR